MRELKGVLVREFFLERRKGERASFLISQLMKFEKKNNILSRESKLFQVSLANSRLSLTLLIRCCPFSDNTTRTKRFLLIHDVINENELAIIVGFLVTIC